MTRVLYLFFIVLGLLSACSRSVSRPSPVAGLQVFGSVHSVMMEGKRGAQAKLEEVAAHPQAHALGALSELRGEITVAQGLTCLSYPVGDSSIRTVVAKASDEAATLLVVDHVARWRKIPIMHAVPFDKLEAFIFQVAESLGYSRQEALPFRIEGPVATLNWHVIDGSKVDKNDHGHRAHIESAVKGELKDASPVVVGFISDHHQGVFTHRNAALHMHFIDVEENLCGHVDRIEVAAGAVLRLPIR